MVACHLRAHLRRPRERLEGFWEEILVEQTLSIEVVEEGETTVEVVVVRLKDARTLVVEDRRREVAQTHEYLGPLHVVQHGLGLQVDGLV